MQELQQLFGGFAVALSWFNLMLMFAGVILGVIIGVLPGAGADMAAWVSYAMSKRFSKEPEKFGTGHPEGLIEAGASNNASVASGWVPALLFGIPGDTVTAVAIGVLYMKGLNPGPTLFTERASSMYALYIVFILANLIMIPLGLVMIRAASAVLHVPRSLILPIVVLLCAVGTYATTNGLFADHANVDEHPEDESGTEFIE